MRRSALDDNASFTDLALVYRLLLSSGEVTTHRLLSWHVEPSAQRHAVSRAWLIVSTSVALKGGRPQGAPSSHARAQFPWSIHRAFRADGRFPAHGYQAVVFSSPPGLRRERPRARWQSGQRGSPIRVTEGRELPRVADGARPQSFSGQRTVGASSTYSCSPLQSLCELLARGPRWDISCGCIWTPPVRYYTQIGVQSNCTPNQKRGSHATGEGTSP